jgi:hypothetical protein
MGPMCSRVGSPPYSILSIWGSSIHRTLINVGRLTNDVLIIHYHALGMHIYHEAPMLLHKSLLVNTSCTQFDLGKHSIFLY